MERLEQCFNRCCSLWIHVIAYGHLCCYVVLRYYIHLSLAVNAFNFTMKDMYMFKKSYSNGISLQYAML